MCFCFTGIFRFWGEMLGLKLSVIRRRWRLQTCFLGRLKATSRRWFVGGEACRPCAATAFYAASNHRLCAAACLEIGHFNRCVGHATRALAVDANDLESLRHRLAAHEALGAWRRMNADALRIGDEDAAARAAAKGGDQPVELHAPSESHKTVQAALDEA